MDQIIVMDKQGNQQFLDLPQLLQLLEKTAHEHQENNFSATAIWEKAAKYLDIFLIGPQKNLTENQLLDLLANVCREENFLKCSSALKSLTSLPLAPLLANGPAPVTVLSKSAQEKLKKLFLPPAQNHLAIDSLIEKIAWHKTGDENAGAIIKLIQQGRFIPHQNILKGLQAFDYMQIVLEDSLNDIFDQLKQAAINFQNLISTNINFSRIRQKMSIIKSTRGFSSGPVSFIKIYTSTFDTLRQNLSTSFTPLQSFTLSIHHPDILEYLIFIKNFQKHSLNKHLRFLIEISPQFLDALLKEEDFELISPENNQVVNLLSAKNTFDLIVSTIIENPQLGIRQQKNLNNNSVQISGMVNLAAYSYCTDLETELAGDLKIIQEYLLKQQNHLEKTLKTAQIKTCIYFTGWTDFLIRKKIVYGSISSIELAEKIFAGIRAAVDLSIELSVTLHSPLLSLFDQTAGIECLDYLASLKINLDGQEVHQLHPSLKEYLTELGLPVNESTRQIYETNSLNDLYQIPVNVRQLFKTSREIDPQFHLELQKEIEKKLQGEIEKRVYFENSMELEKIKDILLEKLKLGINSIGFFQFGTVNKFPEESDPENAKSFLMTLGKNKKRRHREIQPPLFQIKKTEEILLPPVSNQQNQQL
jgi:ribonucleotide reductase alpha subunit